MKVNLTIPQTWNELSQTQLQNIVYQIYCFRTTIKDNAKAVALATTKLYLQLGKELLRGNNWFSIQKALREIQPKEFLPWLEFIYKGVDRTKFLPAFKYKKVWYHPPAQRLRNITIAEFAFADAAFYQWHTTERFIWLDVLCATLYRPAAENPTQMDNRIPYVKQAVDARADIISNIPLPKKLAIAACYEGCRHHIANTYPTIFPKAPEVKEDKKPVKQKYVSFGKIIIEKLDGDPSKLEQTNNVLAYDFLNIMATDIERIKRQKK